MNIGLVVAIWVIAAIACVPLAGEIASQFLPERLHFIFAWLGGGATALVAAWENARRTQRGL